MSAFIWKSLGNIISPGGAKGKLSILIFHSVCEKNDPLKSGSISIKDFDNILGFLKHNYNVLPLCDAITQLNNNELPKRAVSITFDDGYADNYLLALPVLLKWGMNSTFFVTTDYLDGGIMWNDSVIESIRAYDGSEINLDSIGLGRYTVQNWSQKSTAAKDVISKLKYLNNIERKENVTSIVKLCNIKLPDKLMLTSRQLQEMHDKGMHVGGHTTSHPILCNISDELAWNEIQEGKNKLEEIIDSEIKVFAYPNGKPDQDYNIKHTELVKRAKYIGAVSTSWGVNNHESDLFQLARFTPWNREINKFAAKMFLNHFKAKQIAG